MKNSILFFYLIIVAIVISCGKTNVINSKLLVEESSILTFNPNNITASEDNNYVINMPIPNSIVLKNGDTIPVPTIKPQLKGYTFKGWYLDKNGLKPFDFSTPMAKNITVYAKWEVNAYSITYYPNKPEEALGEVRNMPVTTTQLINHGDTVQEPTVIPKLNDYTFERWHTTPEATQPYIFNTPVIQNVRLYAKWTRVKYKVVFYPNKPLAVSSTESVTGMPNPNILKIIPNDKVAEPETLPTLIGYTFAGWVTDRQATQNYDFNLPVTQHLKLYAKWTYLRYIELSYVVTRPITAVAYDSIINIPSPLSVEVIAGNNPTEPTPPQLRHHKFLGWYLTDNGDDVFNFNNPITENKVIYARWRFRPETKTVLKNEIRRKINDSGFASDFNYIDTSLIEDMSNLFYRESSFNGNISNWNVENVEDMRGMFAFALRFNKPLSDWNTVNVANTSGMFEGARAFNQDIGNWNTAKVTNMSKMFGDARAFNQNIGNWNTAKVTNMSGMFSNAWAFNQNIGNWDTTKVENMNSMFSRARNFNQDIGNWDISRVKYMDTMFCYASKFNQDLSRWNTSRVENMGGMFCFANSFNQNLNTWNTSMVHSMDFMFDNAINFNQSLNAWNTSRVRYFNHMFRGATKFNGNISSWNVSACVSFIAMFYKAEAFNGNISGWRPTDSIISSMEGMFREATAFKQNLESWNISQGTRKVRIFAGSGLDIDPNLSPPNWAR